jgi:hypothetical protein
MVRAIVGDESGAPAMLIEWTGDEARAASVALARVANEVDPPKPLQPRMHHYMAKQEGHRLTVYEEAAGAPAKNPRPTGLQPFFSANYQQSIADIRRQAVASYAFVELVVVRHDGTTETRLG